jgi:integrase
MRRVRFRRNGVSIYLTGTPWSEEFMRQYALALDGVKTQTIDIGAKRTIPGSFDALVVSYYKSPEFRGLKPSTQITRRNIIERFRREHGTKPVARLGNVHVRDIIGAKAATPESANNLLKVLRILCDYAISINMLTRNPAMGVKRYKSKPDGFHTWSETEVTQFEPAYPVGTKERLAFALAIYTAQRVSDLVRMGWQHVKDNRIAVRQQKTNALYLFRCTQIWPACWRRSLVRI